MASLKFILRKSHRDQTFARKLCAQFIHHRRVQLKTLGISLYVEEWDADHQRIVYDTEHTVRHPYLKKAEDQLDDYRSIFEQTIEQLEKQGSYSVQDISSNYQISKDKSNLLPFLAYLSKNLRQSKQERTARAYQSACRVFIEFNKGQDIALSQINSMQMRDFQNYLKERGKSMNTISFYMRMLRSIYRKAIRERVIIGKRQNPFEDVFTGFQETRKRALDLSQLRKLRHLNYSRLLDQGEIELLPAQKNLYDCWRYFFFCFHARGMSFVDLAYLRKDNIHHRVISYYRKKTGKKIDVSLTPVLESIISSFSREVTDSAYVFPIIRDPNKSARLQYENGLNRQNKRLKKLAELAGLNVRCGMTTHVSRHSWATMGKRQNLPLSVISEGLGHRSEQVTYTYLASFDQSILDQASQAIDQALS